MSDEESNVNTDLFKNIERLRQLRIEHRDLDDGISRLSMDFKVDELQMKRLKKRKLMLKGEHYMPYGSSKFEFDKTNTYEGLEGSGITTPHPREYFEKLLTYQKSADRRI